VKVCPVCGAMLDAAHWIMDACPVCHAKGPSAPWKIVDLKEAPT
jgi:hypothetical protein